MEMIRLATWIDAPVERCFLLSLSIDLHVASAHSTRERAIGGVTSGLIGQGQTVTFRGRHFGVPWRHTNRIEELRPHSYFRDVMVAGAFRYFEHEHHFAAMDDGTRIRDDVRFEPRYGLVGCLVTKIFVRRHLEQFLIERNAVIKRVAESAEWRDYLYLENPAESRADASVKNQAARRWDGGALLRGSPEIAATRPPHG
jgi:ligand-binding SRPBCC domain-containing protein